MPPLSPLFALPWLIPYIVLPTLSRRRPLLSAEPPAAGRLVSVIVPARNEARNIDPLLNSLRATTYTPVEFIVVDDRSTDGTAERLAAHAAADARIRLVAGDPVPDGWFGKPWACAQGARVARGELLVFTDADTVHHPATLGHAVSGLQRSGVGMLTVVTGQVLITFWERVIMPHIWVPLGARYFPARINAARRSRDVLANGQFFLTTRAAYQQIGTHASVRGEVAEDVVIGQRFFESGLGVRMWWADDLIRTRMYTGLRELIEGWSKNLYLGSRASFPNQPVARALAPYIILAGQVFWLIPVMGWILSGASWAAWAAGFSLIFWTIVCAGMRIPAVYGLTWPLGAGMMLYLVVRSTLRGRRRVEWRGRTYTDVAGGRGQSKTVEGGHS